MNDPTASCRLPRGLIPLLFAAAMSGCAHPSAVPSPWTLVADGVSRADGLALDGTGALYVASENLRGSVSRIGPDGSRQVVGRDLIRADGVVVDGDGRLLVSGESPHGRVTRLEAERQTVVAGGLMNPEGLAVHDGVLYIAEDTPHGRVLRVDTEGRSVLADHLDRPEGLAVGPDGQFFVCETSGNRVRVLDAGGHTLGMLAQDHISAPDGIAYCAAHDGLLVTEDRRAGRLVFIPLHADGQGAEPQVTVLGRFRYPQGVLCAPDGSIYLSEQGESRVLRLPAEDASRLLDSPTE